jgi:hypothetical protein
MGGASHAHPRRWLVRGAVRVTRMTDHDPGPNVVLGVAFGGKATASTEAMRAYQPPRRDGYALFAEAMIDQAERDLKSGYTDAARWVLGRGRAVMPFELACELVGLDHVAVRQRLGRRYPLYTLASREP